MRHPFSLWSEIIDVSNVEESGDGYLFLVECVAEQDNVKSATMIEGSLTQSIWLSLQ